MKYKIVVAFDTFLERFMPPQAINDMLDEDIIESNRRAVLNGSIPADKAKNLVIFKLANFDDVSGELTKLDKPVKLCDLAKFLPREKLITEVKTNVNESN